MNPTIQLICKGHHAEYELKNIINLFMPYIENEYLIETIYDDETVSVYLFLEGVLARERQKKLVLIRDESKHKRQVREALKQLVYDTLCELTKKEMPWGILTGIRPTKIVHDYLAENKKEAEIGEILKSEYRVHDSKIKLLIEVAKREIDVLQRNQKDEVSIYIGIPFCPTRCVYCSFTSYAIDKKKTLVEDYLEALFKEIDYIAEAKKHVPVRSLYVGGGTPTSLNEDQLQRLLTHIKSRFDLRHIEEYTVEAGRPDTITKEKLRIMKALGVSRISINPQSMNQKTLDVIGRKHSVEDISTVFHLARECGHTNINMDIILGLPGESKEDVENTLQELEKLSPDSITVHTMAVKRASRLKEESERYLLTEAQNIELMLSLCETYLLKMGLNPYYLYRQKNMLGNFENVGYAKTGMECLYNIEIMEEKQTILALGAGAITKIVYQNGERIDRVPNVKNVEEYIMRIDEMIERKKQGFIKYQ